MAKTGIVIVLMAISGKEFNPIWTYSSTDRIALS